MKKVYLFILFIAASLTHAAEKGGNVFDLFTRQVVAYPQEKIYLRTDKPHYLSGEKMWFSATIVDAIFHYPVSGDNHLYVELVSPLDSIVSRVVVKPDDNNLFHGFIPLYEGLVEGKYIIRSYRSNFIGINKEYVFKRTVYISDPQTAIISPEVKFTKDGKDYLSDIFFYDAHTKNKVTPENISVRINGGKEHKLGIQDDLAAHFSIKQSGNSMPVMRLKTVHNSKRSETYFPVFIQQSDYEVSFFPEGGQLISGELSTVAFKAIKENGLSEIVSGIIEDENENEITRFETGHNGMGKLLFSPEQGKTYYAVCKNQYDREKRFQLPAAKEGAYAIRAKWQQKRLALSVAGTQQTMSKEPLSLLIHSRGMALYHDDWDMDKNLMIIEKDSLPSGISHILLLTSENKIISERLIFNRNINDEAFVNVNAYSDNYGKRQLVSSKFTLSDSQGNPLQGSFSVAITDDNDIKIDSTVNILSTLLLSSELRGFIEDPAGYFRKSEQESVAALDLLMMTQGWRRYNIPELLTGKIETPENEGINDRMITGKAERFFKALKNADISLLINTPESSEMKITKTDNKGRYSFDNIEYSDSTYMIVQAADKKGNENLYLSVDEMSLPKFERPDPALFISGNNSTFTGYIAKAEQKYVSENGIRTVNLPEVSVVAKRPAKSIYYSAIYVNEVIMSEDIEKMPGINFNSLLLRLQDIRRIDGEQNVYIGNESEKAIFFVNDFPIEHFNFDMIVPEMIDELFVLKRSNTIVIRTKKGNWTKSKPPQNIRRIDWPGYQRPEEFYSPKYETPQEKNSFNEDLRTTLYWNPGVITNENGEASFDFYTADTETTYSVVIEGITNDGRIIRNVSTINKKK